MEETASYTAVFFIYGKAAMNNCMPFFIYISVIDMKKLLCVFFCVMLAALSAVVFTGGKDTQKNYIKYVEFNVTKDALQNAVDLDIQTHVTTGIPTA